MTIKNINQKIKKLYGYQRYIVRRVSGEYSIDRLMKNGLIIKTVKHDISINEVIKFLDEKIIIENS